LALSGKGCFTVEIPGHPETVFIPCSYSFAQGLFFILFKALFSSSWPLCQNISGGREEDAGGGEQTLILIFLSPRGMGDMKEKQGKREVTGS